MDETQKRKVDIREAAKSFIQDNKKIGFIVLTIFTSLFIIYIAFVIFYSSKIASTEENTQNISSGSKTETTFFETLFPSFKESEVKEELDENGLPILKSSTTQAVKPLIDGAEDQSKLVEIEKEPVSSFIVFEKPTSVKKYIQKKPKICDKKLETVLGKDEESGAVKNFQVMLKSVEGYEGTPETGKLDEETRNQLFAFQTRYSSIIYKNKKDPSPTRVLDKETAHFLNLLCNFDREEKTDYIDIPTLRYAKKETRQIVDYNIGSKEKVEYESRIATGTDITVISPNGDYLFSQTDKLNYVETEVVNNKNRTRIVLEPNVKSPSWSHSNLLVYGVENGNGLIIKTYEPTRNEIRRVAEIPMLEWTLFFQSDTQIGFYNKPTYSLDGIYLILDLSTGLLKQVAPPQKGLSVRDTSVPEFSILSTSNGQNLKTLLVNNRTKNIGDLGISTFSEKCARNIVYDGVFCATPKYLPNTFLFPDDWYKGKVLTEDVLVYKTVSGTTTKVLSTLEGRSMSVINLAVERSGIFFQDEKSMSLYSIDTTE